jgi:hypothetical protein
VESSPVSTIFTWKEKQNLFLAFSSNDERVCWSRVYLASPVVRDAVRDAGGSTPSRAVVGSLQYLQRHRAGGRRKGAAEGGENAVETNVLGTFIVQRVRRRFGVRPSARSEDLWVPPGQ